MKISDILTIAAMPGLYKFVAQGRGGIIVEPVNGGRRSMISASAKVSSLGDIAIYTTSDEVALAEVLQIISEKNDGKEIALSNKSTADELTAFMSDMLPNYDKDYVQLSDMKKIVSWYNDLIKAGITDFSVEEAEETAEEA